MDTNNISSTRALYIPAGPGNPHPRGEDALVTLPDGREVGLYSGKTREELSAQLKTEVLVMDTEAFAKLRDESYVTDPKPITEQRFYEALDCLPPLRWVTHRGVESFRFCELFSGNITSIFARTGKEYWEFRDRVDMSDNDLVQKVMAASLAAAVPSIPHPDVAKPVRFMLCCCCGGRIEARQFHNQDTGYGLGDCCVERVKPRTEEMERTYGVPGVHYQLDPIVRVRGAEDEESSAWRISLWLTDRYGALDQVGLKSRPAWKALHDNPALLERLKEQMPWEASFVVRKDGVWGLLFDISFPTVESEKDQVDPQDPWYLKLPTREEVSRRILRALPRLGSTYSGLQFAVPDVEHVDLHRTAVWVFVPNGSLDAAQRCELLAAMRRI